MNLRTPAIVCLFFLILILVSGPVRARENQAWGPIPLAQHLALDRASALLDKDNTQAAIALLEETRAAAQTRKRPVHPLVNFNLGNAYLIQGLPEKAVSAYEACVDQAPLFSLAWLNLARACFDLKRFTRAGDAMIRGYETAATKDQDHLYWAATAYISGHDYDTALSILEKPFAPNEKIPVNNPWREALVHVYLTLNRPIQALPHIRYLADHTRDRDRIQWQETLLYQYMALGMNSEALAHVTRLTTEYPEEPKWWKGMAHFYLGENNHTAALTAMTVYSYLSPLTPAEKRLVADLNLAVGIPARAADLFEEAFQEDPGPELAVKIIHALEQTHAMQKALARAEKARIDFPENREIAMITGELLFSLKRYSEAADVFRSLTETDDTGKAWLMLGYSAWNTHDLAKARQAMEKASTFKTTGNQAGKALALLRN